MEQKFNNNRLDLQVLREFCELEGEEIAYRKGDQLEREGAPAWWFAFVTEGCFMIGEHILSQFRSRYLELHCTTPRERYEMLLQRCPGIM